MSLLAIRQKLRTLSGRYDLVDSEGADSGNADWFINQGMRYLDEDIGSPDRRRWYKIDIAEGDVSLTFTGCMSILEVWVADDEGRKQLVQKKLQDIMTTYDDAYDDLTGGCPEYYAYSPIMLAPSQSAITSEDYTDTFTYGGDHVDFGANVGYSGIYFMPPADDTYTISILGDWYTTALSQNTDTNYWTENQPDLLLYATLYKIETFYRNREGAQDWLMEMERKKEAMWKNVVRQEVSEITQMEG